LVNGSVPLARHHQADNQYTGLTVDHNYIITQYSSLQTQYTNLEDLYYDLQTEHNTITTRYSSLQTQYTNLRDLYDQHEVDFKAYQEQYQSLIKKVNLRLSFNENFPKFVTPKDPEIENLLNDDIMTETASNLTEIKGIGPKRALELEIAGVRTIADLAKRSPQHLAEKTGISITQISKWIIEANKLKDN